jgi:YD repeat-containing protein
VQDRSGQTTTEKDTNGNTITTEYDDAGRVARAPIGVPRLAGSTSMAPPALILAEPDRS